MLKIVSVSLGSSERDKTTVTELLDEQISIQRTGTDGDFARAIQLISELDSSVDAFGLGGIDLHLCAGKRKWPIRDAIKLKRAAKSAPVADGGILKLLLEPLMVDWLAGNFTAMPLKGSKALLVSAVDRWGMAESLARHCSEVIFGDLLYAVGLPFPMRSIKTLIQVSNILAPVITQLPFKIIYPTGSKQQEHKPKHTEFFIWADWICGDFHYIRRNLPPRLDGKVILTNTTTSEDQALLAQRGLPYLITTTPVIDGRSFGMNVLEAALLAIMRRNRDLADPATFQVYLNRLDLKPNIMKLN